jgi:predicted dehydrogenase
MIPETITNTGVKSNLAFIGTGRIGINRMKSLLREGICNPTAIFDPDAENARRAAELAPGASVSGSFDELIATRPDGVVIATPSALHAQQSIEALSKGIAVFCQKPLARSASETRQVISAAMKSNTLLGVDLSYRFTEGMQKIKKLSHGELGKIFAIDLVFNNAYGPDKPWFYNARLSGGGCLIDLGIHLVDLALWILNFPEVVNVSSTLVSKGNIITHDNPDVIEDYVSAQMETSQGTSIRLVCSWNLPAGKDAEISASFYGTKASALFYNVNGSFYDFEAALCHGTSRKIISNPPDDWGGRALVNWARTLQSGKSFNSSAQEYYTTAQVIDRIYRRM